MSLSSPPVVRVSVLSYRSYATASNVVHSSAAAAAVSVARTDPIHLIRHATLSLSTANGKAAAGLKASPLPASVENRFRDHRTTHILSSQPAPSAAAVPTPLITPVTGSGEFWVDTFCVLNLYPTAVPGNHSSITGPNCVAKFVKILQLTRDALSALQNMQLTGFDGTVGDAACQIRAALVLDVVARHHHSTAPAAANGSAAKNGHANGGGNGYHAPAAPSPLSQSVAVVDRLLEFCRALLATPALSQRKTFSLSDALASGKYDTHIPASIGACVMSYILAVGSIKKPWSPLLAPPGSAHLTSQRPPFPAYLTVSDWLPLQQATGPELYGRHFYKNLMLGAKYNLCALSTSYIQSEARALLAASDADRRRAALTDDAYVSALVASVSNAYVRQNHMNMSCLPCYTTFAVLDARARLKRTPFTVTCARLDAASMTERNSINVSVAAAPNASEFETVGTAAGASRAGRLLLDCCSTAPFDSVSDAALSDRIRETGASALWLGMSAVHTQFPDSFKHPHASAAAPASTASSTAPAGRPVASSDVLDSFPPALHSYWRADHTRAMELGMCEPNPSFCHVYHVRTH